MDLVEGAKLASQLLQNAFSLEVIFWALGLAQENDQLFCCFCSCFSTVFFPLAAGGSFCLSTVLSCYQALFVT